MSMFSKARKLSLIASNPHLVTCQTRYLFILSHMRSRSTVISHVLGSNPEICGYSELHQPYRGRLDLLRMRAALYEDTHCRLSGKYLLDKILHNHLVISAEVLALAEPSVIFLLRDAESTLKSIINMGQRTGVEWYRDPQRAADYYCRRLAALEEYATKLQGNYLFVDAEELVDDTDQVLAHISDWLQLQHPLNRNYEHFRNTGKRHYGDSSDNIKSGVIQRTQGHPAVSLPPDVLAKASAAYERCRKQLLARDRRPLTMQRSA
ncbi:sulfotransferase family protein [Gilvimarinus sp. F26214L]|uniref:sulfotransferase family protein n=1 Tax=Gilvimarinus sp. DZF01 TaxID=3461371 RepID=UPI0040457104